MAASRFHFAIDRARQKFDHRSFGPGLGGGECIEKAKMAADLRRFQKKSRTSLGFGEGKAISSQKRIVSERSGPEWAR